jgi:hypothetical protein
MKRSLSLSVALAVAGMLSASCTVVMPPQQGAPAAVAEGPVVADPGVEVIQVEPAPTERVYVYDPGYPPGVYLYNDYYWYGGYRYPRDVFINQYVAENIRENRYVNVEENRRMGQQIEAQHRAEFARTGGVRPNYVRQPPRPAPKKKEQE